MSLETRYITVDLLVKGDGETAQLIAALEAMDYVVQKHEWDEGHEWYLNVGCARDFDEPEPCILKYCEDLEALPLGAKAEWDKANVKELSIGYETGGQPSCFENHLEPAAVARIARLGSGIGIVLYPARPEASTSEPE